MTALAKTSRTPVDRILIVGLLIAWLGLLFTLVFGLSLNEVIGFGIFFFALARVAIFQNRPFMLRWLIVLVAVTQWVIAPIFAGDITDSFSRWSLWIPLEDYLDFAVPAVTVFMMAIFLHGEKAELRNQQIGMNKITQLVRRYPALPIWLAGISFAGDFATFFLPKSLLFVAYLLLNLKFAAVILFLFSKHVDRYLWIIGILGLTFVEAASTSLFHDAFLWSILIGGAYVYRARWSILTKSVLMVVMSLAVALLNSVKADYRDQFWVEGKEASAIVYFDMTLTRAEGLLTGEVDFKKVYESMVVRLNQGRIVSRVMYYIPDKHPYFEGETIKKGIVAALVPRFIVPDKEQAGGRKTYQEMTGLRLLGDTSMGVSVLGEAYGNFGRLGGILFMGVFGYLICISLNVVSVFARENPLALVLIPCVFFHVVKAETDFTTVLNFLVKSSVLYFAIYLFFTRIMKYRAIRSSAAERGELEQAAR